MGLRFETVNFYYSPTQSVRGRVTYNKRAKAGIAQVVLSTTPYGKLFSSDLQSLWMGIT
jgi:predicted O-linked N-acetylglucosamine transferase (SPINDLY family)